MNKPEKKTNGPISVLVLLVLVTFLFSTLAVPAPLRAQSYVPVDNVSYTPFGSAGIATGLSTSKLNLKSIYDALMTSLLKTVIVTVRDMVLRWITTGRFEGPVFSASFTADAKKAVENASRTFLGGLTGVNFCAGFNIPSRPSLSYNLLLGLQCTAPNRGGANASAALDMYLHPERYSDEDRIFALQPENLYPSVLTRTIEAKLDAEMRALASFNAEYTAGNGFLGIRDEDGKIITPGSYVADYVKEMQIVSPQRQVDVANTVQQAIDAIVTTAFRVSVERGLSAAFSGGGGEGGGGGGELAPPSPNVISQKISGAVGRARAFLAGVPRGVAPIEAGISAEKAAEMENIILALNDYQSRLADDLSSLQLRIVSNEVDSLVIRLDGIMLSSSFCVSINRSSPLCPPTP